MSTSFLDIVDGDVQENTQGQKQKVLILVKLFQIYPNHNQTF